MVVLLLRGEAPSEQWLRSLESLKAPSFSLWPFSRLFVGNERRVRFCLFRSEGHFLSVNSGSRGVVYVETDTANGSIK